MEITVHCLQTHTQEPCDLDFIFLSGDTTVGGHFSRDKDGYHTWHMVRKRGVIPYRQFYFPFHVALFTCTSMKMRSAPPARLISALANKSARNCTGSRSRVQQLLVFEGNVIKLSLLCCICGLYVETEVYFSFYMTQVYIGATHVRN